MPSILALDIGTSSVRAARFGRDGTLEPGSLAQLAGTLATDPSGRAEMDPIDLLRRVERCLKHAAPARHTIEAVGVSCFWHSLLGTDAAGHPLTPIYTWADARCRPDALSLREELSEKEVHAETGCMLRTSFWPAKLRWLRRTRPTLFRKVARWMSPAEWLQLQLTGSTTCAHGMATGTGLYDPRKKRWSPRMVDLSGLRVEQLNPLSDEPSSWNGITWYPAIGDGAASNLGSGATQHGVAAINVGTSAAVRGLQTTGPARSPFGLFCLRVDTARYLVGGAVSNAGSLHAWSLRELRLPKNPGLLEKEMASRPTPEHGLTVLPFWSPERAPDWDETSCGTICGMTQATTAPDMLQAITEAFYFRIATIADLVAGKSNYRWVVSGGILHSPSALQRLANVMGRPLHANAEREASLRGAAVFALEKRGAKPSSPALARPVKPSKKVHEAYLAERARTLALTNKLR